jgi:NitT/TauT family transport system substrate-binding protein
MRKFRWRTELYALLMLSGMLFTSDGARALDNVTLITDFGFNGRHAYFFVAIEKGYYKDADLEVKVVRGQGSVDAIRQVGANNAILGFADAGSLVLARGNDQIPVKLVSIVYARPPQAIFCREDSGLKQPKDLEGVSIANPAGGATVDMFPIYARAAGFDAGKVKWIVAGSDALPVLLAGNRVPCVGQFTVGEPLLRRQAAPARLVRFAFADAGRADHEQISSDGRCCSGQRRNRGRGGARAGEGRGARHDRSGPHQGNHRRRDQRLQAQHARQSDRCLRTGFCAPVTCTFAS